MSVKAQMASCTSHWASRAGEGIGGDGDSRGAARIWLRRGRDKVPKPFPQKYSLLLLFRPFYFGNIIKAQKMQNGEKSKMARGVSTSPTTPS